jgi:hypothetical protein
MGNEMGSSRDLIDFQEGRTGIPNFQVGNGNERFFEGIRSSEESSDQQGVLNNEMEAKERPHLYEDSCGVAGHVNEDDEKLNTSITEEEDQRSVLIIGGIHIFLPISPTKANARVSHEEVMQRAPKKEAMGPNEFKTNCVCDAGATEERKPTETFKEEEKEKTLMSAPQKKRSIQMNFSLNGSKS